MPSQSRLVALVTVLTVLAGCSSGETAAPVATPAAAAVSPFAVPDPAPTTLDKNTPVGPDGASVQVGTAQVTVPAGAVTAETSIHVPETAAIDRQLAELYGQPVGVQHDAPLQKPVSVRWSLPPMSDVQRASLVLVHWNEGDRAWEPRPDRQFRLEGDVLSAELTEFSFWDWVANAGQTVGEITGARKDGPKCGGAALPPWVRGVVDPDEGTSAAAVRVCFEPDHDDLVTVRVVNNRPFTQQLMMSSGNQSWAWTWPGPGGQDVAAAVYEAARAAFDSKTSYLLPPLTEVAVGVDRPAEPGPIFIGATAKVTRVTVLTDVVRFAMDQVNVGGFDNPLLTAFVQAVYECGGKQLLNRHKAAVEGRWATCMRFFAGPKLLVIDELGYLPLPGDGASALFQVVNQRYLKSSTILTTNVGIADWATAFGDATVAAAMLDRLLHRATVVGIDGPSYRLRSHQDTSDKLRKAVNARVS
ncbi:ATP-binding protein [Amycolatopsis sp. cmx-8-4]|uniref:ATP-binding protein n=1 Tax=Amycolatopsis sp. cmx-8-4 TaxID=2790947 RepID=UPI00397CCD7C